MFQKKLFIPIAYLIFFINDNTINVNNVLNIIHIQINNKLNNCKKIKL